MPSLSTRLTGDVLCQAVHFYTRIVAMSAFGPDLTRTDWAAVARNLEDETHAVIHPEDVERIVEAQIFGATYMKATVWDDAAAALCDAIEARREPDAAPEGER